MVPSDLLYSHQSAESVKCGLVHLLKREIRGDRSSSPCVDHCYISVTNRRPADHLSEAHRAKNHTYLEDRAPDQRELPRWSGLKGDPDRIGAAGRKGTPPQRSGATMLSSNFVHPWQIETGERLPVGDVAGARCIVGNGVPSGMSHGMRSRPLCPSPPDVASGCCFAWELDPSDGTHWYKTVVSGRTTSRDGIPYSDFLETQAETNKTKRGPRAQEHVSAANTHLGQLERPSKLALYS